MEQPGKFNFLQKLSEQNPGMQAGLPIVESLRVNYWLKLREFARNNPAARKRMAGMIVAPEKISFYLGKSHAAVEYFGPTSVPSKLDDDEDVTMVSFFDYREVDLIGAILGMKFTGSGPRLPLPPPGSWTNLFLPSCPEATILMMDNGWDITAEDMAFAINTQGIELPKGEFARMENCFFYSAESGQLRTRRVQWIDFFPVTLLDQKETETTMEEELLIGMWPDVDSVIENDSQFRFPYPAGFESERLALLNRFRELILGHDVTEPQITAWLAQPAHQFILKMALPATDVLHQKKCAWKTGVTRPSLIPDFFAVRANGYSDIVEFKLPELKNKSIVGPINRETFSAEIQSYIAQARTYKEYFSESVHRELVKQEYGIVVHNPVRVLVMGRRWQFESEVLRSVQAEFPDLTILTYDDLIDSVTSLLYQNPKP